MIQIQSYAIDSCQQTFVNGKYNILKVRLNLVDYHTVMSTIEQWRRNGEQHFVTLMPPPQYLDAS